MTKTTKWIIGVYLVGAIAYGAQHDLRAQIGFSGGLNGGAGGGGGGASTTSTNSWTQAQTFQNGIIINPNGSSQRVQHGALTTSGLLQQVATFTNNVGGSQTVPEFQILAGDTTNNAAFLGRYLQLNDTSGQHNAGIIFEGNAAPIITTFPPTIASGFGTSPSISTLYGGGFSFTVTVGTGGTATTGQLTFPAANSGGMWNCMINDETTAIATRQSANTSTTVNVTAASAWTAADKLRFICAGG